MARLPDTSRSDLDSRFEAFLSKYTPEIAALAREVLARMRKKVPGALELVYDNYNALVIGFGPTERASDAVFSIALYPRWVTLFFLQGAALPDPEKRLKGDGKIVRHVVLESAKTLDEPAVRALMTAAMEQADPPFDQKARRGMVIKSVSARQRPRRPALKTPALKTPVRKTARSEITKTRGPVR